MIVSKQNTKSQDLAIKILKSGGLIIFPCETVYGAAVDATNPAAVKKLNSYKQRPLGKPYAIMVADKKMAVDYVDLNQTAENIYREFLPGPITVISKGKHRVAEAVESEEGNLGVRLPAYPYMRTLIKKLGRPIAATSANASYKKRPYKINDILDNLSTKQKSLIDLIIDAGELPHNEPSTVIDTTPDSPVVLRQGDIKLKDKVEILSRSAEATQNTGKELLQKFEHYLGERPVIFALEGPMGVGKTQFTKGIGKALGIKDEIVSPTFNLVLEYGNNLTHIDAWRLQSPTELENLDFIKVIENKNMVIAIEWAEKVMETVKKYRDQAVVVWVKIKYAKRTNERKISWGVI